MWSRCRFNLVAGLLSQSRNIFCSQVNIWSTNRQRCYCKSHCTCLLISSLCWSRLPSLREKSDSCSLILPTWDSIKRIQFSDPASMGAGIVVMLQAITMLNFLLLRFTPLNTRVSLLVSIHDKWHIAMISHSCARSPLRYNKTFHTTQSWLIL